MKKVYSFFLSCSLLLGLLLWGGEASASTAEAYLKTKQTELTALVKDSSAAGQKKLQTAFDEVLDYEALARDSLGDQRSKFTPEQEKEFQALLTTLVQRSYTKNLKDTLSYEVQFRGQEDAAKGKLVRTLAKHKTDARKEPITIDYVLHQVGGKWRVIDIVTEGSSLVSNYRSQFRRLIEKRGVSGLLERMKDRAANEK